MLTSLRQLVGMPVICQNRQLGYVEQAVAQKTEGRLEGVVIRRGIGSARWCAAEEILSAGPECVVVARRPVGAVHPCEHLPGRAYLTTGQCIGEVTDWIFQPGTFRFAALEVSPGPIYRLMGRCAYACEFRADPKSGSVVVPRLLSWTQLKRQLGEEDDG
ncbi:MAG: hypothetical protein IKK75_03325 [Clostridia bacterium]|nr:hypothetical protein [Clostridia bacterium]